MEPLLEITKLHPYFKQRIKSEEQILETQILLVSILKQSRQTIN